jgi:hypothetical protein
MHNGGLDAIRSAGLRPLTALRQPTVVGLVIGRRLLYPPDDDVAVAVDTSVSLFAERASLV